MCICVREGEEEKERREGAGEEGKEWRKGRMTTAPDKGRSCRGRSDPA